MATKLGDIQVGLRMREAIKRISTAVVNELRPEDRIGKVFSVNSELQTAKVLFPGESTSSLVTVHFATNMTPRVAMITTFSSSGYAAAGDVVRVSGKPGAYWISDYVSGRPVSTASTLTNYRGYNSVVFALTDIPNNNVIYTTHQFLGIAWPGEADIARVTLSYSAAAAANSAGYTRIFVSDSAAGLYETVNWRYHNLNVPNQNIGITTSFDFNAFQNRSNSGSLSLEVRMQSDVNSGATINVGPAYLSVSFLGVD